MREKSKGFVHEVFRSIQGEGIYVGVLQIFVRLSGCSARCIYCDTPRARVRIPECRLSGGNIGRSIPNPVDADEIVSFVRSLSDGAPVHSISITGGEPLEQPDFLLSLLPECRKFGLKVYLETNGLHPDAAESVAGEVDIVALDLKLPSLSEGASLEAYPRVMRAFSRSGLFCKVVVAKGMSFEELEEASRIVAQFDKKIPLVIQPATDASHTLSVDLCTLLECQMRAAKHLDDVRIIPQCHHLICAQ